MAIGDQVSWAELQANLLSLLQQYRQVQDLAREFSGDISNNPALNTTAALQTLGAGSLTDAQNFLNMVGYLTTNSGIWFGTATQGSDFDFDTAAAVALGGTLTP